MNGLHGASLIQKMTNKSNLSDELVKKRDACKELKLQLEETKQISVSFANALSHLKSSAALISQQKQAVYDDVKFAAYNTPLMRRISASGILILVIYWNSFC